VKPRATRSALIVASVPLETARIISMRRVERADGFSAKRTSSSVGAP
jgi:hypothetical protein